MHLSHFISFCILIMSPGPNFIAVMRNALSTGLISAFFTALGITAAFTIMYPITLHMVAFLQKDPYISVAISVLAGMYLLYLGTLNIKYAKKDTDLSKTSKHCFKKSFKTGFITHMLNPKSLVVGMSILAGVNLSEISLFDELEMEFFSVLFIFMWFSLVGILLSRDNIRIFYKKHHESISYIVALYLFFLGAITIKTVF